MEDPPPGYIDEYNQLRAEIRMYLEHGAKNLQMVLVLGTAAITFGTSYPQLLLVSAAIVCYMWFDEIRHLRAVQRTAAYLEVFVEPHVAGLKWETYNRSHDFDRSILNRAFANAVYPTLLGAQLFYGFHLLKWPLWIAGIAYAAFGFWLGIVGYLTARNGRDGERNKWERIRAAKAPSPRSDIGVQALSSPISTTVLDRPGGLVRSNEEL